MPYNESKLKITTGAKGQSELIENRPLLALDVGDARIGVAISENRILAYPLCTIQRRTAKADISTIAQLVATHDPIRLVVGLPLRWDGQISIQGQKVKDFAAQLAKLVPAEIVFWDERLTTVEAERLMIANKTRRKKKKQKVDQIAAALILEDYIEQFQLDTPTID